MKPAYDGGYEPLLQLTVSPVGAPRFACFKPYGRSASWGFCVSALLAQRQSVVRPRVLEGPRFKSLGVRRRGSAVASASAPPSHLAPLAQLVARPV